jgi:hypothetical protein
MFNINFIIPNVVKYWGYDVRTEISGMMFDWQKQKHLMHELTLSILNSVYCKNEVFSEPGYIITFYF